MANSGETSQDHASLNRVIGIGAVAVTAFNCIVGVGIFGLPALVAAALGPAAIIAYAICLLLIACVGLCFAEAGSRLSSTGGLYAYVYTAYGPVLDGVGGMLVLIASSVASGRHWPASPSTRSPSAGPHWRARRRARGCWRPPICCSQRSTSGVRGMGRGSPV